MMSRSCRPSSSAMRPRTRPQLGSRTSSASSINSQRSLTETSLPRSPSAPTSVGYFTAAAAASGSPSSAKYHPAASPSDLSSSSITIVQESPRFNPSHPIRITLPPRRSAPVETPPEPLSARGDLLGGYFPLHEDFQRSYKPHPFHAHREANKNQPASSPGSTTSDGSTSTMPETESPLYSPRSPHPQPFAHNIPTTFPENSRPPSSTIMPPSNSPLPLSMPMGKYHPSNYKNKNQNIAPSLNASTSATTSTQASGSSQSHSGPQHKRQASDVRKKLQQYQRDMVEQAALAARMQLPGIKPTSPRLLPLGSPGPVTPMELEESGGYLLAGGSSTALSEEEIISELIKSETKSVEASTSTASS